MAPLQSNADLSPLRSSASQLCFDVFFKLVILCLLISVCDGCTHCSRSVQCMYIPSCYPHLTNPLPLPRSIPISLTVPRPQFSQLSYGDRLSACRPYPSLEDQSTLIIIPRHDSPAIPPSTGYRLPVLVALYLLHGLQWD
jgi:hypothetical protein